jgi:glycosyltransferase involved in cell wall biosynthesis
MPMHGYSLRQGLTTSQPNVELLPRLRGHDRAAHCNEHQEPFRRTTESYGGAYDAWLPDEADFSALSNVTILRPREAVAEIYDQSRTALVPSQWKGEFGRVTFEGAANGSLVITSGMPSLRENAGEASPYASNFKNVDGWIERIVEFGSPVFRESRRRIAQEYVRQTYDLDRIVGGMYACMCGMASR